jgi:hypothetical protein
MILGIFKKCGAKLRSFGFAIIFLQRLVRLLAARNQQVRQAAAVSAEDRLLTLPLL